MAQTGFTPISLYYSATAAAVPTSGNLIAGELAINTNDGKLFYKDSAGVVQVIGTKGGVGSSTTTQVLYNSSGLVVGSANLTFNGTTLTANTIGAFTLGGTIAGGGNQINNVIIGASTPLAGSFTTLSASGVATFSAGSVSAPAITTTGDTNTGIFFPAADTIAFTEGGVESMRIDSSGNLLVGKTIAAYTVAGRGVIEVGGSSESLLGFTIGAGTTNASYLYNSASSFEFNVTGSRYLFWTVNGSERMRIDSDGNLLVGTTSGSAKLNVTWTSGVGAIFDTTAFTGNRDIQQFKVGGVTGGSITFTSNGANTAYVTSSDYRLKENIAPMQNALNVVQQLKPVTYSWKTDGSAGQGFIAHELAEVCPEAVIGEKDAVDEDGSIKAQGIDTSFLVATLTAAIQELKAIVDAQTTRIAALESK